MTMTFGCRDRRLALVEEAIASLRLAKPLQAMKSAKLSYRSKLPFATLASLHKEQAVLSADRYEVSDAFAALLGAAWTWEKTANLLAAAKQDLALRSLKREPVLTDAAATDIQALPRADAPTAEFFDLVQKIAGADAGLELAGIALGEWLRTEEGDRENPVRDIAVLLPLRLETIFNKGGGDVWRLLLRVTPDEPSILRHDKQLSPNEADFLAEFWEHSSALAMAPDTIAIQWLSGEGDGAIAWAELCDRVGAPRAAWMVAQFPPQPVEGRFVCEVPADRIGENPPPRVSGLPLELAITAYTLDGSRLDIGKLSPQADGIPLVMPGTDFSGTTDGNWLTDWKAAKDVGLGGEFPLPAGCGPETIAALYVHGVGDEAAGAHFAAHADAGTLGLLQLGAPTNSIEGGAAADLGKDPAAWRTVAYNRMAGERGNGLAAVALALGGSEEAIADVPGSRENTEQSRELAQALWPALWGHWSRDMWGGMDDAYALWDWANHWLAPEGPLTPLRIDTQPYGLLPAMALERWEPAGDGFDALEERMVKGLVELLSRSARTAEASGTVAGTDEAGLLALLGRTGVSSDYDFRTFVPPDVLAPILAPGATAEFNDLAATLWRPTADIFGRDPAKAYMAIWGAQPLTLPLIGARRMPEMPVKDFFYRLYELESDRFGDALFGVDKRLIVADSLLIRLMIWSAVAAKAWYMQSFQAPGEALVNPTHWGDPSQSTPLEARQRGFKSALQSGLGTKPVAPLVEAHRERILDLASRLTAFQREDKDPYDSDQKVGTLVMPAERAADLERALRATLDTASHRLDPWAIGIASHRLSLQTESGRANNRLGAYGWLDGPFVGKPGPNESGRLHAPSYAQALTSIILRDKFLSANDEAGPDGGNIWRTELDSAGVRMAIAIASEIRLGFHVFDVVGRRVEEIVAGRDQIAALRKAMPLRPERPDPRDVCQGPAALAALLSAGIADVLSDDSAERDDQTRRLAALNAGLDAFADLLLAEGVHNVVSGHADLAANAMDAAAGFARPPDFEVVRTPPSGYRLATSIVSVMPYQAPVTEGPPLELADPSLAAFLSARFGDASLWAWQAKWVEASGDQTAEVALATLKLSPLEAMLIPEDFLGEVVRAGLGQPRATVQQADGYRLMKQVGGMLASQPALAADISAVPDDTGDAAVDSDIQQDLRTRYGGIHAACAHFAEGPASTDSAGAIAFLRTALTWGIVGSAEPAARQALIGAVFNGDVPEADTLTGLVQTAKSAFQARIEKAPDPASDAVERSSPSALARMIADLAQPNGRLAITASWPVDAFRDRTAVRAETDAALDSDWLPVVAAVRPALARLEAVQLEASILGRFTPMAGWTAAPPGDPWRVGLVRDNKVARDDEVSSLVMSRLVNAYGPADAFEGGKVAVGLVDQFSEAVPMAKRTTYAAFGFNAPAARAPQAILLGVPSKPDRRLASDDVLQILIETRRLTRARAARPEDGDSGLAASSAWFQASGPLRVDLSGTQYTR